ncbi:hypothetical protein [Aquimarina aggregata]|uniref:hypothetical protein n=1 Tax=Aquimarina aggregata TaxID=1642818 RepID=UPI00249015A5|nr:hypothetical protein [Aquimarina aggregata]
MNKIYFLLLALLFMFQGNGQMNIAGDFRNQLHNFIPTSPEAATLGRYGAIPLNSPTGHMQFSVPIHTINLGGKTIPIALSYHYNGFLLEGKPSLMGLGWSLQGTAAVVRETRGLPDDHKNGYYGINNIKQKIDNYHLNNEISIGDMRRFASRQYDSEADKYIVNAFGLNFAFKIDASGNPVFLSQHNHKVAIFWDTTEVHRINSFTVTDTQGIQYVFSETETIIPEVDEETEPNTITSWNISKIIHPNLREVNFEYQNDIYESYDFDAAGSAIEADIAEDFNTNPIFTSGRYNDGVRKTTMSRKLLNRITFHNGSVALGIYQRDTRDLYQNIVVRDFFGKVVNRFDFTHEGNRDILTTVTRNQEHWYAFEYSQKLKIRPFMQSLQDKELMWPQDSWKYYNASSNRAIFKVPSTAYVVDNKPNVYATQVGALKKIIYPTKGYSKIDYEANQVRTQYFSQSANLNNLPLNASVNLPFEADQDPLGSNFKDVSRTLIFDKPTVAKIEYKAYGNTRIGNHIDMRFSRILDDCPDRQYYPSSFFPIPAFPELKDKISYVKNKINEYNETSGGNSGLYPHLNPSIPIICPQFIHLVDPDEGGDSGPFRDQYRSGRILIMPGRYELEISTNLNIGTTAKAEIKVDFHNPPQGLEDGDFYNKIVGGVRVSRITDYDTTESTTPLTTRKFIYNDDQGISTGILMETPLKTKVVSRRIKGLDGNVSFQKYYLISSQRYSQLNTSIGNPVYYKSIKTINTDDDNGYQVTTYGNPINYGDLKYINTPQGADLSRGLLASDEKYKKNTDATFSMQMQTKNSYQQVRGRVLAGTSPNQDENPNHPISFVIKPIQNGNIDFTRYAYDLNPTNPQEINAVKGLYQTVGYKELDSWFKQTKQITEETLHNKTIRQEVNYLYDTRQQLKETTTLDSKQILRKQLISYPYDFNDPTAIAMNNLNQIAAPVKIENFVDGTQISKEEREYSPINSIFYRPQTIKYYNSLSMDDYNDKLNIVYDTAGNIIQTNRENGIYTSFLWGYQGTLPIAKIDNIKYADIPIDLKTDIDNLASKDFNIVNENALRDGLGLLRQSLPDLQVTTYTHNPFIGVTSQTDPRGYTMYYEYDTFNRLEYVRDDAGKLISENKYGYKN